MARLVADRRLLAGGPAEVNDRFVRYDIQILSYSILSPIEILSRELRYTRSILHVLQVHVRFLFEVLRV